MSGSVKDNCKKCGAKLLFSARDLETGLCHVCAHVLLAAIRRDGLALSATATKGDPVKTSEAMAKYQHTLSEAFKP